MSEGYGDQLTRVLMPNFGQRYIKALGHRGGVLSLEGGWSVVLWSKSLKQAPCLGAVETW